MHVLGRITPGAAPADRHAWPPVLATMVRNAARNKRRRHFLARPHEISTGMPVPPYPMPRPTI